MPPVIKFEIDGKPIEFGDIKDAHVRYSLMPWKDIAQNQVGDITCRIHKKPPTIIFNFMHGDIETTDYRIETCCGVFRNQVRKLVLLQR